MRTRSQDALATLLLVNHLTDPDARPLGPKEFWQVVAEGVPSSLMGRSAAELAEGPLAVAKAADRIAKLLDASTALAFALERLGSQGFVALTPFDDAYPRRFLDRLGDQAPPVLFAVGQIELLSEDAIGIVGSRDVDPAGVDVTREAAATIAKAGLVVVSGGAKGVDQQAMAAAYQHGGSVVGYLADSLERRVKVPDTRRVIGEGHACLVTMFKPSAGFSVASAMTRNKLIYGGSRATLVVASDQGSGGTWAGATEAMKRGYGHVLVWRGPGEGPGNAPLVEAGGTAVTNLGGLMEASVGRGADPKPQLSLEI